jgi:hypothetical protein
MKKARRSYGTGMAAPQLAEYFSRSVAERSRAVLRAILKRRLHPMQATIGQQVSLIKWIPSHSFTNWKGWLCGRFRPAGILGS